MSNFQVADIEQKQLERQELNALRKNTRQQPSKGTCRNCGGEWPHEKGNCPARGKECRKCGKINHFARQCRSSKPDNEVPNHYPENNRRGNKIRPVVGPPDNQSESSSSDESSYCYAVKTTAKNNPTTKTQDPLLMSSTSLPSNNWDQSHFARPISRLIPVKMKGKFQTTVESRKRITVATIYVTEADGGCLLSANTAEDLGLITLHLNQVKTTKPNSKAAQQVNIPDKGVQHIVNNHSSVFQGQGKLQNKQIELIIDETVKPVAQKQRRIPFNLREKVERELSKLEHDDIIEPVPDTEETDWISPLVIVPKKDDNIRLCVDMRAANNGIERVRHPIPTVKDVSLELNDAKFFTKLDLTQAYHQLELSPSSRHITTFATHNGIYRFKRLNYGTNSAAEIFQHTLQQVLQGIKGVRNIADDILIFGSTYEEHNTSLEECLQRLEANGLTLNLGKCLFLKQNLDFFGLVFSKDGVSPDPKQISALANSTTPTTPSEVRSLLGMANFSAQFMPNFATITEPLRMLTHKNIPFTWGDEQENAYQTLKTALISKPVMSYFDPGKETVILVDWRPVGLCAILAQRAKCSTKTHTISYGSRALTSTEKRYSQTEKEALAIVWGYRALPSVPVWGPIYTIHRSQTA
ncbi:Retrovirus-related Pol poly [Paramuricea clavata]|uniref:Retrovirus-related Pol poly n=1 Tax=Paramuricea clavata TaxID=317549 RepID=A0A6S7HV95_PARCT|nr:Retrovirus-related Pol poly [Paramuricea clavata]